MTDKPKPEAAAAVEAAAQAERRAIERLDAGEPAESEQEERLRAPYQALIDRVRATEESASPPEGWEARAMGRFARRRRRRWGAAAAGVAVSAGLAAALLLLRCETDPEPRIQYSVMDPSHQVRRGVEAVGDTLHMRVRGSLLLYLGNRRIAACPGAPRCRSEGAWQALDWRLEEAGTYSLVVIWSGDVPLVPPAGRLDLDLVEARKQGADSRRQEILIAP